MHPSGIIVAISLARHATTPSSTPWRLTRRKAITSTYVGSCKAALHHPALDLCLYILTCTVQPPPTGRNRTLRGTGVAPWSPPLEDRLQQLSSEHARQTDVRHHAQLFLLQIATK